jgi:hypothetical protein
VTAHVEDASLERCGERHFAEATKSESTGGLLERHDRLDWSVRRGIGDADHMRSERRVALERRGELARIGFVALAEGDDVGGRLGQEREVEFAARKAVGEPLTEAPTDCERLGRRCRHGRGDAGSFRPWNALV